MKFAASPEMFSKEEIGYRATYLLVEQNSRRFFHCCFEPDVHASDIAV